MSKSLFNSSLAFTAELHNTPIYVLLQKSSQDCIGIDIYLNKSEAEDAQKRLKTLAPKLKTIISKQYII